MFLTTVLLNASAGIVNWPKLAGTTSWMSEYPKFVPQLNNSNFVSSSNHSLQLFFVVYTSYNIFGDMFLFLFEIENAGL